MKKLILFLPLLVSVLFVKAQFSTKKLVSNVPSDIQELKVVDLDSDGQKDILVGGTYSLVWFKNNGDGSFSSQKIITEHLANILPYGNNDIAIADLNNNGLVDIIVSSYEGLKIAWFENYGDGTFSEKKIVATNVSGPHAVYSIDLNNDGFSDILSASFNSDKIAWFENFGDETFSNEKIISTSIDGVQSIFGEDINNDGFSDVLVTSKYGNKVSWFKNSGNETFGSEKIISDSLTNAEDIITSDINNDSQMDVVATSPINNKIVWYPNLGSETFDSTCTISSNATGVNAIYIDDLNNDGKPDVLTALNNGKIVWYENTCDSLQYSFSGEQLIYSNGNAVIAVYSTDIDNDGDIDIFSGISQIEEISWHESIGLGNYQKNIISQNFIDRPQTVISCDLDNDNDIDLISTTETGDKVVWFENSNNGKVWLNKILSFINLPQHIDVVDIDNDGDMDVFYTSSATNITWNENMGGGNFGSNQSITMGSYSGDFLKFSDLDNDGDSDLIVSGGFLFWLENLGGGTFSSVKMIDNNSSNGSEEVIATDINNDGFVDVVAALFGNDKIAWYENLGNGTFSIQKIVSTSLDGPRSIYAADIDNDADIDIVSASYFANKIAWHENLGNETFAFQKTISNVVNSAYSVIATDIDNDGFSDVVAASQNGNFIKWYKNIGNSNFVSMNYISTSSHGVMSVHPADIDNDGDVDIVQASFTMNEIAWYENYFNSPYQLKGNIFYDSNQNTIIDSNEFGLSFIQTQLQPNGLASFTSNSGNYSLATDTGTYTVNYIPNNFWDLTTDSSSYTKTLTGTNPIADSLDFGFYPNTITTIIEPELTGGFPRCNTIINYWVNIRNEGTTLPDGIIHLQLDDSVSYVSSINPPDSIVGQNIYWHFDSLFFFAEENFNIQVQMPPFTSIGDTLTSILSVYEIDSSNNIVYTNTDTLNQVSVCAYDPNDKTVLPKGIGSQGFIANNQPLEYLIRFQNTGNDTALTVMVRDQLDDNLDWASLKPLASSHPMQVWIEQDGEAVFRFNNIMLPDSNVDFLGSQGFVKFSINQNPNLAPNTPIFNTGHIYFDYNTAVITNTVLNTIEDTTSFPVSVQEITFTETNEIIVFPNPFTEHITVYYKAKINAAYHVSLFDMSGKELLKKENNTSNKTELDVSQLKNGIYIIVGTDTNGKKLFSERIVAQ